MSNLIQEAKMQVAMLAQNAYSKAATHGQLPAGAEIKAVVDIPKDLSHGDYATSFALAGAKLLQSNPRAIAQILVENMELEGSYFDQVTIAGPGFLNFKLGANWYGEILKNVENEGANYGAASKSNGQKVMVEFVSANPTGPMHMGNARGGVLGDTLANVLKKDGCDTWKEFYVNDAGNQINKFAVSINARYMQIILGEENFEFPETGYQGGDIRELAQELYNEHGDSWKDLPEEDRLNRMSEYGLSVNLPKMQADLKRYGIVYDQWFFESELYNADYVKETVDMLTAKGSTYVSEGALWLNTTELLKKKFMSEGKTQEQVDKLDLKDDVLCRANGFYTYFAADIAYHRNKLDVRKFDKVINIWGADHHGHVARIQSALDALDLDGSNRLVVVLMQLVNLMQDGKAVRMSKRSGKAIALHDLLDDISVDAARYFFNSRTSTSPLDFDLDLAVRQDSENPVYYVQYAHARICSLITRLKEEGATVPAAADVDATMLSTPEELALLKIIAQLPEEIHLAARDYDPSRINRYLGTLAADFHRFYNANRIKGEEPALLGARLKLADTVRAVLANGMDILGVSVPEKM